MKNFYITVIQGISMPILLLLTSLMSDCFAQEKQMINLVDSHPVVKEQNSFRGSFTKQATATQPLPVMDLEKFVPASNSIQKLKSISPSFEVMPKTLRPELKSAQELSTGLAFKCDGSPVAIEDEYVAQSGQDLVIGAPGLIANDIDPEGDAIIAANFFAPSHGTLTSIVTNGSFVYVPDNGFTGIDTFQYRIRDANLNFSDYANVIIHVVEPFNRNPIAVADEFAVSAGTTLTVSAPGLIANDIDPDGDAVIAANFYAPSHGTLTSIVTNGSFIYVSDDGFTGIDTFRYRIRDAELNFSDYADVVIHVYEPFNRNPIAVADEFTVSAGTTLTVNAPGLLANDIDPDGDAVIAANFYAPSHGTLTSIVTNGSFIYVPDDGFTGVDTFRYRIRDAELNFSDFVNVIVKVVDSQVNPIASEDFYVTGENQTLTVAAPGLIANDIDPEGDAIIAANFFAPSHGTLTSIVTNGSFVYVPDNGFTGIDTFQYRIRDANLNFSDYANVIIHVVEPFNRNPIAVADEFAVSAGTTLTVSAPGLIANDIDPDGDAVIAANFYAPSHGTLTSIVTNGSFIYVSDDGFTGIDTFRYRIRDAELNFSDYADVVIHVYEPFNRNPIAVADEFTVSAGTTLTVNAPGLLANDIDPDGDAVIAANFYAPSHGTLTSIVTNGSFIYVPDDGFTGVDTFRYRIRDAELNFSDYVNVIVNVFGEYQPPVASAADIVTECQGPEGTPVTLDGSASTFMGNTTIQYTWYENGSIIAGPSSLQTAEVILMMGVYTVTLMVEDECGNTSTDDATVTVEDTSGPLVVASFLPTSQANYFEISCSAEDVCSEVVSSLSVIRIPELVNPVITLKNQSKYALEIDMEKNTVSVKAPDASSFWATILSNGGVVVGDGQVISAKYDKNKYKYSFDASGNLLSVEGNIVTLKCTATDSYGNTSESEAILPENMLKSVIGEAPISNDEEFTGLYRNYPNPFSQRTTIEYRLEIPSYLTVSVFDQVGRMVEELEANQMPAGIHRVIWDAASYKPGVYYYMIEYNGIQLSDKMILLRH